MTSLALAVVVVVVIVWGTSQVTLDSNDSQWTSLDASAKLSLVEEEFKNLHYTGMVSAKSVVKVENYVMQQLGNGPLSIRTDIETNLGSNIASQELSMLEVADYNQASAEKELSQLKQFMGSQSGGKMLQRLQDTSDIKNLQKKVKQLTAQVKQDQEQAVQKKKQQENIAACPLKVIKAYVQPDSINTPEAYVIVENVSHKTIDAYKVAISCYDAFGSPVNDIVSGNNIFNGIEQNISLQPGETTGYDYSWMLATQDTTTNINVAITEVHFTDGSTWS